MEISGLTAEIILNMKMKSEIIFNISETISLGAVY